MIILLCTKRTRKQRHCTPSRLPVSLTLLHALVQPVDSASAIAPRLTTKWKHDRHGDGVVAVTISLMAGHLQRNFWTRVPLIRHDPTTVANQGQEAPVRTAANSTKRKKL